MGSAGGEGGDAAGEVGGEPAGVLLLELGLGPVQAGHHAAAGGLAAEALELVVVARVAGGVVERELLADRDVAHRDQDAGAEQAEAFYASAGRVTIRVRKEIPGHIANRLQAALWREAISLVENGVCDAATVDLVVKNSFGARLAVLGPLENADLVGTDLTLDIHRQVLGDLEDSHAPSPFLENLVAEGKLGFKSHEGFRSWTDAEIADLRARIVSHLKKSFG